MLVDASAAFDQPAGIGRYARNILRRILASHPDDAVTLLRAPVDGNPPAFFTDPPGRPRIVTTPFSRRNADRLWFRLGLPLDARLFTRSGADVVYSPDFTAPPMAGVPRIITVHDLAFMTHPQHTTEALQRYLNRVVPKTVAAADAIAVVSRATRDDVHRLLGVPLEKMVVAPCGVEPAFYEATSLTADERAALGIPDDYLLMLGTIEPRKNHLNAFRALELSGVGKRVPMVVAGRPGWGYADALASAEKLQERGEVRLTRYVPEPYLAGLIAGARAVVFPSWTEGFGLPVAEAMAAGVPVITSTAPALQEVGGPFARYADPGDIDALAEQMRAVCDQTPTDDERQARRQWTRQFSWDDSAALVYERICAVAGTR